MGNCLFDSLNVFIRLPSSHALRLALCNYIRAHPDIFDEAVRANGYNSVEDYVRKMGVNGVDGDHVCIGAASLLFNTKVHVHMPNGRVFTEEPKEINEKTQTAHIKWFPGHYSVSASARHRRRNKSA